MNVSHLIDKDYNNVESERFVKEKEKKQEVNRQLQAKLLILFLMNII